MLCRYRQQCPTQADQECFAGSVYNRFLQALDDTAPSPSEPYAYDSDSVVPDPNFNSFVAPAPSEPYAYDGDSVVPDPNFNSFVAPSPSDPYAYDGDSVVPDPNFNSFVAPSPSDPYAYDGDSVVPEPPQLNFNNFVAPEPSQPYLGHSVAPGPSQRHHGHSVAPWPSQPNTGNSGTLVSSLTEFPSPDEASPSPEEGSPSPEEGSPSPEEGSPSPEEGSPSPEEGSPSPEEGSPSPEEASPSPPASASNISKTVSKSTTVPAVQAVTSFSGFSTPSDFGNAARANFINTIKASLSSYNVDVVIDSVSAGSIVVTSTTTFLDGSQAGANAFVSTIGSSTAASSLFPAATYGTVTSTAKVQLVANADKSSGLSRHWSAVVILISSAGILIMT
ncbi:TPA: hypothetical protein ACH3X3_001205 [Trebouxia sp. C0006]